jgi:hypothetical protein
MPDDDYPSVPATRLADGGWKEQGRETRTLASMPGLQVVGHTVIYEDPALRQAVADATDGAVDQSLRFFFATRLTFRPPLAPGVGTATVRPTVVSAAERAFADRLRDREVAAVERGRRERVRTEAGKRAHLRRYTGQHEPAAAPELATDVEGWLGVWAQQGTFRLAGGAYPAGGLSDQLGDAVAPPGTLREELLALVRGVS